MLPAGSTLNGRDCDPTSPWAISPLTCPWSTALPLAAGPSKERTWRKQPPVSSCANTGTAMSNATSDAAASAATKRFIRTLPQGSLPSISAGRRRARRYHPRFQFVGPLGQHLDGERDFVVRFVDVGVARRHFDLERERGWPTGAQVHLGC